MPNPCKLVSKLGTLRRVEESAKQSLSGSFSRADAVETNCRPRTLPQSTYYLIPAVCSCSRATWRRSIAGELELASIACTLAALLPGKKLGAAAAASTIGGGRLQSVRGFPWLPFCSRSGGTGKARHSRSKLLLGVAAGRPVLPPRSKSAAHQLPASRLLQANDGSENKS